MRSSDSKDNLSPINYQAANTNSSLPLFCRPDLYPSQITEKIGNVTFDSCFDSGNLERYNLWIAADCSKTQRENQYRTWFHFSVTGVPSKTIVSLTIKNMNFQTKLFKEGMMPVYYSTKLNRWERVKGSIGEGTTLVQLETCIEITFYHDFIDYDEKVFFAFTYPWTYADNLNLLRELQNKYKDDSEIYFHRTLFTVSKENRRIDLITISSYKHITEQKEKQFPGLFPDKDKDGLPQVFQKKRYIFISARVHPGEVPGSHVFNGVIKFLLNQSDIRAQILRDNFVFYLVPMINPDGVYRGHYRTDTQGTNLNRCYINPSFVEHPSVYAIRELILNLSETKRIYGYIDLHAHATRKGCFMYGNCVDFRNQVEICTYCRLISLNTPYFEYDLCNFTERNMYSKDKGDGLSKEGSGRVALYKQTKINLCYTLECNYNMGSITNKMHERSVNYSFEQEQDEFNKDILLNNLNLDPFQGSSYYIPDHYENIGEALLEAFLDINKINPVTRIQNSPYLSYNNLKLRTSVNLMRIIPFRFDTFLRKILRYLNTNEMISISLKQVYLFLEKNIKNENFDQNISQTKPQNQRQTIQLKKLNIQLGGAITKTTSGPGPRESSQEKNGNYIEKMNKDEEYKRENSIPKKKHAELKQQATIEFNFARGKENTSQEKEFMNTKTEGLKPIGQSLQQKTQQTLYRDVYKEPKNGDPFQLFNQPFSGKKEDKIPTLKEKQLPLIQDMFKAELTKRPELKKVSQKQSKHSKDHANSDNEYEKDIMKELQKDSKDFDGEEKEKKVVKFIITKKKKYKIDNQLKEIKEIQKPKTSSTKKRKSRSKNKMKQL